jgi:RNA polymerase sigma-70 factor (ECF subfamily)
LATTERQQAQLREWIAAVARRDAAAFRCLYEATSPKLFGFAMRILGKGEWAEDVLQESFVSVWHGAAGYRPALAAPMTWMATIVRNKAFDALRRRNDTVEIDADTFERDILEALESPEAGPADTLQASGDARSLAHCMDRLDGLHRQAIALAYFHDMSHSEVAGQLKLPIGTVKTWIRRGLERLRQCLATLGGA